MGKEINIAFTSTAYGPLWAPAVCSWLQVVGYTARQFAIQQVGKLGGIGVTDRTYTMTAENLLVKEALANPDFTHVFMTEMDMILPHDTITKLVALDKDMASGVYFLRADTQAGRGQPCLYKKSTAIEASRSARKKLNPYYVSPVSMFPTDKPFRVDVSGLGCVLFKREVFDKLTYPWFDLKAGTDVNIGYGSDIYFYYHARKAGLELWVDPTIQCKQIDYYETDIEDYRWQLENNPNFLKLGFIIGNGDEKSYGARITAIPQCGVGADVAKTEPDQCRPVSG